MFPAAILVLSTILVACGGSGPGVALPTVLVALERDGLGAAALEARLRGLETPVLARILDDRVVLDLRTVPPESDERLAALLRW